MKTNVLLGALTFTLTGCLVELDGIPGYMWCVEAVNANGSRAAAPHGNVNIVRAGDWITGCAVYCAAEQDVMLAGEAGDIDMMMDPELWNWWQDLRNRAIDNGVDDCEERVAQLEASGGAIVFTYAGDKTCAQAIADADNLFPGPDGQFPPHWCDYLGTETGMDGSSSTGGSASATATATTVSGTGADTTTGGGVVGPGIYDLTSYNQVRSCTTNSTAHTITCNVDQEFIAYLSENRYLLDEDDATLATATGPGGVIGWKFDTCGSTSLMYALGLRTNDLIYEIEGFALIDYATSLDLWGQLGMTSWTGIAAKAKFYRGSVAWTMTVNRTNFSTYP